MENFKKTLHHTDPMVLDDFGTSLPFIDIYFSTLDYQDTTVHKSVPALAFPGPWGFLKVGLCQVPWESEGDDD